jgi:P27 family predicted phage terminase small subunit
MFWPIFRSERGPLMAGKVRKTGAFAARGHRTTARRPPELPPDRGGSTPNPSGSGYAPRELGAEGRRVWRNAITSAPWLDQAADRDLLRRFAALHDERVALEAAILECGRLTTGSTGQEVARPEVAMLASVDERIVKLAGLLGLGPAARQRLTGRLAVERERPRLAPVVDLYERMVGEGS